MEYHQVIQNRAGQTVAVIDQYIPGLKVGNETSATLLTKSQALDGLAQTRDDALTDFDGAANAENTGFLIIRGLALSLPKSAEGELNEDVAAESALLDLLSPVYSIQPRTTELAIQRGQKLKSALTKINTYLAAQTPARGPITSGGKGVTDLTTALDAQPPLEQALENRDADVSAARMALRDAATAVDRLNKRFYAKLVSEGRTNPTLAQALSQIQTTGAGLPFTLGINSILQGGTDGLHILVNYDAGSFDGSLQNSLEWMVAGVDLDFVHNVAVDASGNALGPFTVGQTVKLRTRVTNSNGTTTSSVRQLTMLTLP